MQSGMLLCTALPMMPLLLLPTQTESLHTRLFIHTSQSLLTSFYLLETNADPLSAGSSSEDDLVQLPGEFVNMSHPNKRAATQKDMAPHRIPTPKHPIICHSGNSSGT
ncbi:hypothetical protein BASA60_001963 [Batrachochytrium salamandrivorans]|nr:hypothetical protein BASA60_001963 [Batrachochytrium salamandrivorans]